VFIICGSGLDKKTPDLYDWLGAGICLIGASVILFAPRQ
jgi:small multidrug resistance family-3 protein